MGVSRFISVNSVLVQNSLKYANIYFIKQIFKMISSYCKA